MDLNERVDIPLMLKILQHEVQALSNGRHEITFRVNDQLKVFGNEDQLRSAVSNLVYNAVNHTPEGTKIEVCWQQTPQGAQFQVSDNGPGILLSMFLALRSASIGSIKPGHGKRGQWVGVGNRETCSESP